jgi:hypothetical protein
MAFTVEHFRNPSLLVASLTPPPNPGVNAQQVQQPPSVPQAVVRPPLSPATPSQQLRSVGNAGRSNVSKPLTPGDNLQVNTPVEPDSGPTEASTLAGLVAQVNEDQDVSHFAEVLISSARL